MAEPDRELPSPQPAPAGELHPDEAPTHPPFKPLFTLLTNTTTNTTIHPRVHYVFSDDDPSLLTTPHPDPSSRSLVVDLVPSVASGWSVAWGSSLSPDFAVTDAQVAIQEGEGDGSLVLRIEGVAREAVDAQPNSLPSSGSGVVGREDVEGLVEDFKRRMGVLKKVIGEGEKRREAVGQLQQEVEEEHTAETEMDAQATSKEGRGDQGDVAAEGKEGG